MNQITDTIQNIFSDRPLQEDEYRNEADHLNQMSQSKQEVKKMLGEDIRKPSVRKQLRHEEPEKVKPQKKKQKDYER